MVRGRDKDRIASDVIPNRAAGPVRNLLSARQRDQQIPHRRFAPIRNDIAEDEIMTTRVNALSSEML
jgi:hypothetical protein